MQRDLPNPVKYKRRHSALGYLTTQPLARMTLREHGQAEPPTFSHRDVVAKDDAGKLRRRDKLDPQAVGNSRDHSARRLVGY